MSNDSTQPENLPALRNRLTWYWRILLYIRNYFYVRIFIMLALVIVAGLMMHGSAAVFKIIGDIVLRLLQLLAIPLILVVVVQSGGQRIHLDLSASMIFPRKSGEGS
jgi:hypothetical protein